MTDDINMLGDNAKARLRHFVRCHEEVQKDIDAAKDDQKQLMAEAKAEGFNTKILRKAIAARKQDADKRSDEQALLDLYLAAL